MSIEFLRQHQLTIMMFMSGICGVLAVLAMLTRSLSEKRRYALAMLEVIAMLLLIFDRYAYIYRGDISIIGYWMVRISNFLVYLFELFLGHCMNIYLSDLFRNEGKLGFRPKRIYACEMLFCLGCILLIYSQFTGLFYTFDENNLYQRGPGHIFSYMTPFLILFLQLSLVIQYRKRLSRIISTSLILNTVVPIAAAVIQLSVYGLSLINMSIVGMAIFLYIFVLIEP